MIRICMWCQKIMGEKEPIEDISLTHGICEECAEEIKKKRLQRKKEKEFMENPVSRRKAMIRMMISLSDSYTSEQLEGMSDFAITQIYNKLRSKYLKNPKVSYNEFIKLKQEAIARLRKDWEEGKISMHRYHVEKMLWNDRENEYYTDGIKDNPLPGYTQSWRIVAQDIPKDRAEKVAIKWRDKGYEVGHDIDETGRYIVYVRRPEKVNPRARVLKKPSRAEYCPERIQSPSKLDSRSFRTITSRAHKLTVGCPKGEWDAKRGVCKVPMELQRILHPAGEAKCQIPGKEIKHNPATRVKTSDDIEYTAVELYAQGHGVDDVRAILQHEFGIDRIDAEYYSHRAGRIVRGDVLNVSPKVEQLFRTR